MHQGLAPRTGRSNGRPRNQIKLAPIAPARSGNDRNSRISLLKAEQFAVFSHDHLLAGIDEIVDFFLEPISGAGANMNLGTRRGACLPLNGGQDARAGAQLDQLGLEGHLGQNP